MNKKNKFSMVPIKKTDVFQTIIERITQLIEENHYQAGERLPSERELSESLGVSRTSVRQAIKVLEAMGKVETRVGSGTYVMDGSSSEANDRNASLLIDSDVTQDTIRQLIVARAGIERAIFEECSKTIDQKGIEELKQLLQEHEKELELEIDIEDGGLDLSFEAKVAEMTQNEILIKLQQQIHQLWVKVWREYGYAPEKKEVLHNEHLEILNALEDGHRQLVVELIVQHVNKEID